MSEQLAGVAIENDRGLTNIESARIHLELARTYFLDGEVDPGMSCLADVESDLDDLENTSLPTVEEVEARINEFYLAGIPARDADGTVVLVSFAGKVAAE